MTGNTARRDPRREHADHQDRRPRRDRLRRRRGCRRCGHDEPARWLAPHAWAEVEIPKFADPPPFAIDVYSDVSGAVAWAQARRLFDALERFGWNVSPPRAGRAVCETAAPRPRLLYVE